ncbi:MAG: tetratricopeptide repeat protein [Longimicrobiales bacterium]|nr:tetratricopeptide repeat protein [Longimicrobiales bacterium]
MSRRKRRESEKQAELLSGEQGDLLAGMKRAGESEPEPEPEPAPEAAPAEEAEPEPEPALEAAPAEEAVPEPEPAAEPEPQPPNPSVVFELVPDELGSEPPKPPPAGERLNRARDLAASGRIQEALALYRAIVAENPNSVKARSGLGELVEGLGQHEAAREQFEAASKIEPDNVEVLNNLGAVLGVMGRYDAAEAELRRALRLSPDHVAVRASLGILHYRRGLYAQAEVELGWVCDQAPDHGNAHFYRGESLNRLGRVEDALSALERATVLQPTNGKAFHTLGILYDRKHLPEEAAFMYRRARELLRP